MADGGGGDDVFDARDTDFDRVTCGPQGSRSGETRLDGRDVARRCRSVRRTAPGLPRVFLVGQSDLDVDGFVRVGVDCSQDQPGGCRGSLRLTRRGQTLAGRVVAMRPGTGRVFRLQTPPGMTKRLARGGRVPLGVVLAAQNTAGRPGWTRSPYTLVSIALTGDELSPLPVGDDVW